MIYLKAAILTLFFNLFSLSGWAMFHEKKEKKLPPPKTEIHLQKTVPGETTLEETELEWAQEQSETLRHQGHGFFMPVLKTPKKIGDCLDATKRALFCHVFLNEALESFANYPILITLPKQADQSNPKAFNPQTYIERAHQAYEEWREILLSHARSVVNQYRKEKNLECHVNWKTITPEEASLPLDLSNIQLNQMQQVHALNNVMVSELVTRMNHEFSMSGFQKENFFDPEQGDESASTSQV